MISVAIAIPDTGLLDEPISPTIREDTDGKEAVLLIGLLCHFPAHIGEMQGIVLVHREKASVPQGRHRIANTGLCDLQVPGHIHGAHRPFLLLENQNRLQVVLAGRMDLPLFGHTISSVRYAD